MLGLLLRIVLYLLVVVVELTFCLLHADIVAEVGQLRLAAALWEFCEEADDLLNQSVVVFGFQFIA